MSASKARSRGIQGRRWVTLTDIAAELRVRPDRIRELGILDGCARLPPGTIGRYELWLWPDVEQSVLELASGASRSTGRSTGTFDLPAAAFDRVG